MQQISGERLQDHWSSGLSLSVDSFSLFLVFGLVTGVDEPEAPDFADILLNRPDTVSRSTCRNFVCTNLCYSEL